MKYKEAVKTDDKRQLYPALFNGKAIWVFDPSKATHIASKPTDTRLGTRDWALYQLNTSKSVVVLQDEVATVLSNDKAIQFVIHQIYDIGASKAIEILTKLGIKYNLSILD